MHSYLVTGHDGEQVTVEANDYTMAEGFVAFRDHLGHALVVLPTAPIARIDCTYVDDERITLRRRIKALEDAAEVAALQETIQRLEARPNREQRRARS